MKESIIASLQDRRVALTTDLWTSVAGQGYITVTGHFVTGKWEVCCKVLATRVLKEQHTGIHLARVLECLRLEFHIGEVLSITTDNAANMKVMAKSAAFRRIPCFSHTLQLAVNDALKTDRLQKCFGACRRLVICIEKTCIYDPCCMYVC